MSNHREWLRKFGVWLLPVAILIPFLTSNAQAAGDSFSIQVSPSPLAVQLTPGQRQTANLTVRNLSNHPETLVPRLNGFTIDRSSEKIELKPEVPLGLGDWISFSQSSLEIAPGASKVLTIVYDTPQNVGFSYSLAITLTPAEKAAQVSGANYQASIAVFNLININRGDAKRELSITHFAAGKSRYEYLPVDFTLTVANKGNVIDQPAGNIFIQRKFADTKPIATIPINKGGSYILPDTSRNLANAWEQGFPHYVTTNQDGKQTTKLVWDWRSVSNLRMGKYIAKVVLVYNDGQRDVPLVASYSFWVIPWKLILVSLVLGGLVVTGLIAWTRLVMKGTKKVRRYAKRR